MRAALFCLVVPAVLGLMWMYSNALVFLIGTAFAVCSLVLSQNIPLRPAPGILRAVSMPAYS